MIFSAESSDSGARADQAARILELEAALGAVLPYLERHHELAHAEPDPDGNALAILCEVADTADVLDEILPEVRRVLRGEEPADG